MKRIKWFFCGLIVVCEGIGYFATMLALANTTGNWFTENVVQATVDLFKETFGD